MLEIALQFLLCYNNAHQKEKDGKIMLSAAKKEFIEFMMSADVLRFGDFVTKSGRNTPYFVNTGN